MNGLLLYRTSAGPVVAREGSYTTVNEDWDQLLNRPGLLGYLQAVQSAGTRPSLEGSILPPIGSQEVWAAGVTYHRSRTARIEESAGAGGAGFYDRVYAAERPELFFKSAGWRVRGPEQPVRIRRDARWSVPEPELVLCLNARGEIVGYTIGNDMSARDIEGENPLYLPQAKIYDGACALGPAILLRDRPLPPDTEIRMRVARAGSTAFQGSTSLASMRRTPDELVAFLCRATSFPAGCMLLTGTGVVPPEDFALQSGDDITIEIPPIGTLRNRVE